MARFVNQPDALPTVKVAAATAAAAAAPFLADLLREAWAAFPDSGEPFFFAAFVLAVAWLVPEVDRSDASGT